MNGDLVAQESVPILADDTLVALAEQAEKRVEALNKIKRAALRSTNPHDWTDQGGKPYLEASGCQKVGRVFGVSWRVGETKMENEEGGHFRYEYTGEFSLAGATITAIGTRSSKDGFFKKYDGKGESRTELPPSEIDKGDVQKSAYTNLLQNGIKSLLGLKNLSWDDLNECAGITKDLVAGVKYKKDGKTQEEIKSEGALSVTFIPSEVFVTNGKNQKTGKAYTKYTVKGPDGEYNTFSETFAKKAQEAKSCNELITVTYKVSKFGNDIENVTDAIYEKEEPKEE